MTARLDPWLFTDGVMTVHDVPQVTMTRHETLHGVLHEHTNCAARLALKK